MDVILASNKNLVRGTKIISDHDLVYVVLKLGKERPKPVYIKTGVSRITNKRLFSKIFLKSLGLLWTVLTTSKIALMRSIFYSKKSWMGTQLKSATGQRTFLYRTVLL